MNSLGFSSQAEANLEVLTTTILKSSEIEGELLNKEQVRSSLARRLGLETAGLPPASRHVDGFVELMLDATQNYLQPLTEQRLFSWHRALFPTASSGLRPITVGAWRTPEAGPMQVVSGPMGREAIHFEAPEASRLQKEMELLFDWFNHAKGVDPFIKAGVAHFWFVTIHPFEDGNGRIARAIADSCLALADRLPERFYSMSAQIETERTDYYDFLEQAQKGELDITAWLNWFLNCLSRAIDNADKLLEHTLFKVQFWQQVDAAQLNARQTKVLNRFLDGFEGKLTSNKYGKLAKCSHDTALRDIQLLIKQGVLEKGPASGRSSHYLLTKNKQST